MGQVKNKHPRQIVSYSVIKDSNLCGPRRTDMFINKQGWPITLTEYMTGPSHLAQ